LTTVVADIRDRRKSPRVNIQYHGRVRFVDTNGVKFKTDIIVDNVSANGLYLRLPQNVAQGSQAWVSLRLSTDTEDLSNKLVVAMRGVALRAEPMSDGTWGVAVAFTRYRVL